MEYEWIKGYLQAARLLLQLRIAVRCDGLSERNQIAYDKLRNAFRYCEDQEKLLATAYFGEAA